jgi:predicted metal-dependent hydrolase
MLDWTCGELAKGLSCYGREEFFATHEHWELVWLKSEEPEKSFVQALIQVAAAFHHWQRGNQKGAVSLLGRALRRLEMSPAEFGGIEVAVLRVEVVVWLRRIQGDANSLPQRFPRIRPVDSNSW